MTASETAASTIPTVEWSVVAADLDLTRGFPGTAGVLENHWTIDNGGKPHEATHYLTKTEVGRPVGDALVR